MNKTELVEKIAEESGVSKAVAKKMLESVTNTIGEALASGDNVNLIGFGSFNVKERAARNGRNPQTGKDIKIPAKKVVKFNPGKALKDRVA